MTFEIAWMFIVWATAVSLTLYSAYLVVAHFRRGISFGREPQVCYPISVLKPLKGKDKGIEENLRSFFTIEYKDFELIFSVSHKTDSVCQVVEALMEEYPQVQARLIVDVTDIGPNPKINNLILSYREAKYDWILISDSNVRVRPNYLVRLSSQIQPGIGMITSVVSGQYPKRLGGYLEAVFLNTFYARGMVLAFKLGHPCVVGKSMLFQRSVAQRFGGIEVLARYIAEDYMAGEGMKCLGLRVVASIDPICQFIGEYSLKDFWSRHLRWGRIRKAQAPLVFAAEPLTGSIVSGLLGAWCMNKWFGISSATVLTFHFGVWILCDLFVIKTLGLELNIWVLLSWVLREFLSLPLWICVASGNTVSWRGMQLTLQPGGTLKSDH